MGKKRTQDGIRINFYIERIDLQALEEKRKENGLNVSEQIRFAVKDYLGNKTETAIPRAIHKPSQEVVDIIKYISNLLPAKGKHTKIELKKDPMMLMFSKEWFKLKQMIEMTSEVLKKRKYPDIIFEQMIYPIEVSGTNRTRQERYGFSIDFGRNTNGNEIAGIVKDLEKEMSVRGRIEI